MVLKIISWLVYHTLHHFSSYGEGNDATPKGRGFACGGEWKTFCTVEHEILSQCCNFSGNRIQICHNSLTISHLLPKVVTFEFIILTIQTRDTKVFVHDSFSCLGTGLVSLDRGHNCVSEWHRDQIFLFLTLLLKVDNKVLYCRLGE